MTVIDTIEVIGLLFILLQLYFIGKGYFKYVDSWLHDSDESVWNPKYDKMRAFFNIGFFFISVIFYMLLYKSDYTYEKSLLHKISFLISPDRKSVV